jgi:radical SAM superfamily enzyme YgiQ (UPF0313 family)
MTSVLIITAAFLALSAGFASVLRSRRRIRIFRERFVPTPPAAGRRRKVLIISTTLVRDNGALLKQGRLWLPALNVGLLAALTPPDWEAEILYETIEDVPWNTDADLIALSCMGVGLWRGLQIAAEFRARGKTVVIGGPMASIAPDKVAEHCDSVCVGDAEGLWETILRDFERGRLKPLYSDRPRLSCLEAGGNHVHLLSGVPVPRYDLMIAKKIGFWLPVLVGRGCPHHCEFCSIHAYYEGRYLRRPVADVVRDVEAVKSLGVANILLIDDNIGSDPRYAMELCRALKPLNIRWMGQCALTAGHRPDLLREMAESGCRTLSVGLESVNQKSLESAGKMFVRVDEYNRLLGSFTGAGIDVSSEMILGLDADGPDTFARTADFILQNRIRVPRFYILTPIPGTPLHERMIREGRIFDDDYGHYSAARAVFTPLKMTPDELESGYWQLYEKVFSYMNMTRRFLARPDPRRLKHTLFLFGVNLHYRSQIKKRICPGVV